MAEPQFPQHPFLLSAEETARVLETDIDKGLTSAQVAELQQKYPKNELQVGGIIPWHKLLAKQVLNAMIIVRRLLPPPPPPHVPSRAPLTAQTRCWRLPWP